MQLRKHHSVHTGAKPHQCDVCGRTFRERGTLREHHRIHTGAMPFTCEFCGKAFRFKGILTVFICGIFIKVELYLSFLSLFLLTRERGTQKVREQHTSVVIFIDI